MVVSESVVTHGEGGPRAGLAEASVAGGVVPDAVPCVAEPSGFDDTVAVAVVTSGPAPDDEAPAVPALVIVLESFGVVVPPVRAPSAELDVATGTTELGDVAGVETFETSEVDESFAATADDCVVPSVADAATLGSTVTSDGAEGGEAVLLCNVRTPLECAVDAGLTVDGPERSASQPLAESELGVAASDVADDAAVDVAAGGAAEVPASVTGVVAGAGVGAGLEGTSGTAPIASSTTGGCGPGLCFFAGGETVAYELVTIGTRTGGRRPVWTRREAARAEVAAWPFVLVARGAVGARSVGKEKAGTDSAVRDGAGSACVNARAIGAA